MSRRASWGLIGFGSIGRELVRQVAQPGVATRLGLKAKPEFILRSRDKLADIKDLPDVVFVAIPSSDDGRSAYEYISRVLKAGKIVITAEKGALANHFALLRKQSDNFARLGAEAAVGGGTRLVSELAGYCRDPVNVSQLHLVLNGTLTAIYSAISSGNRSMDQAVQQAVEAGYAEPGNDNPQDVIKAEAESDIPKKTAILFNLLGLGDKVLDWRKLEFRLTDDEVKSAKNRRFIVSVYPMDREVKTDVIGGFRVRHDGWTIAGGFQKLEPDSPLANLKNADNGFVIGLGPDETDGVYSLSGPGAGVRPTVNTMLDDYLALK